jgi:aspartyl-tRNA(Asn)/glutamyl-tRNA(Gln) amidotransferase subunit C
MPALSSEDIAHLSHLARLRLTDEEQDRFARQLSGVVEYVEKLSQVAIRQEASQTGITGLTNVLAADELRTATDPASVDTQALVDGAPHHDGRFIRVRAVLTDEAGGA